MIRFEEMAHSTVRDRPLFFDGVEGGGGVGKFWNKLFAEAVITEKNCMQVKKEDGDKKNVCSRSRI